MLIRWWNRRRLAKQVARENRERQIKALLDARAQIVIRYRTDGNPNGKHVVDVEPFGHPNGVMFRTALSEAKRYAQYYADRGVWINDHELIPARFITSIRVHER